MGRPQSNGFIERCHRTLLDEHLRVKGRTTWYESVSEKQADPDGDFETYNHNRPYGGRGMEGRTPYQVCKAESASPGTVVRRVPPLGANHRAAVRLRGNSTHGGAAYEGRHVYRAPRKTSMEARRATRCCPLRGHQATSLGERAGAETSRTLLSSMTVPAGCLIRSTEAQSQGRFLIPAITMETLPEGTWREPRLRCRSA